MNANPYEAPKSNGPANPPATKRRWFLQPLTVPFLGAAIGAAVGAAYAIGLYVARFWGVMEPWQFLGAALDAAIVFGMNFTIVGGAMGLVVAPFLWIVDRFEYSGSGK
jgi:hypothetical protein